MNRQTMYVMILSLFLLVGVVGFSVLLLIPKGKEYRTLRLESKKEFQQLDLTQSEYDNTESRLKDLRTQNAGMIKAFNTSFNPDKFERKYKKEFSDLYLTELNTIDSNGSFKVYEVNATTKITSPEKVFIPFWRV